MSGLTVFLTALEMVSGLTDEDRQVALVFKANDFRRDAEGKWRFDALQALTQKEINEICGDSIDIQELIDKAAENVKSKGEQLSRGQFGTRVHQEAEHLVKEENAPGVKPEVPFEKNDTGAYDETTNKRNEKDSIRVDIRQFNGEETICIHDIKTGRGLDKKRIEQIFEIVSKAYPKAKRILITEARPDNLPLPKSRSAPRNR